MLGGSISDRVRGASVPGRLVLGTVLVALVVALAPPPVGADAGDLAARHVEPVVLNGVELAEWSRLPAVGRPAPYPAGDDTFPAGDGVRSAHHGTLTIPPDPREATNIPVDDLAAFRWEEGDWIEVPVQVDERYPYFLANARADFSTYSGTDTELTYAFDPSRHARAEEAWKKVAGECEARYPTADEVDDLVAAGVITPGLGETAGDYTAAMPDPVAGLDDDDEIVFMASDAGERAPDGQPGPSRTRAGERQEIAVTDPLSGTTSFVYLFLANGGSKFRHANGYVRHQRPETADWWADRDSWSPDDPEKLGTSNTGYGPNLPGTACVEADGTDYELGEPRSSSDRFPLDGMTISTATYRFHATGRWMLRSMQVATPGSVGDYGPDLVDRWKGRAFQQSPDSEISVVGFEDEQVNWEANAALLGWRSGPVRTIREVWGADSGTNVTKTEYLYRDAVKYRYRVRVHPIPPDGLYTSWDYNHDVAARYYNALRPEGVAVDGANDDVGNVDGAPPPTDCDLDRLSDGEPPSNDGCDAYFDAPDPTFDLPTAVLRWEQVSGAADAGSLVYIFEFGDRRSTSAYDTGATSVTNAAAVPYYRDDRCFDDGTGDDPSRRPWPGEESTDPRVYGDAACTPENALERQGAFASHGLHFFATQDTDNAWIGVPVNEIDGSQWQFAVPTSEPTNVGEPYAQVVRVPLAVTATSQPNPSLRSLK